MSTNTENLQRDNYEETFSNLTNVSRQDRLELNLVNDLSRVSQETENSNINFINGNLNQSVENKVVDFLFSVENNNNIQISVNNVNSVIEYKTKVVEGKFSKLNNKLNSFLSIRNNHKFLQDTILEKFENLNQIVRLISSGIEEKTQEIRNKSFENILKKELYSNQGKYFNKITNYFIKNLLIEGLSNTQNSSFLQPEVDFLNREFSTQDNLVDVIENNFLEDSLIKIEKDYPFRYIKSIRNTSSDLVIQSIINFSRSLYTVSTNSFLNNYVDSNNTFINFEEESLKNHVTERRGFNIFDFISPEIDYPSFSRISSSNMLRQINSQNIIFNNSYLDSQEKNFLQKYDSNDITESDSDINYYFKYKNRIFIGNPNVINNYDSERNNFLRVFDNFCLQTNKYFTESIYDIDYSKEEYGFELLYDSYYRDLHNSRESFNGLNIRDAFSSEELITFYQESSPFSSLINNITKPRQILDNSRQQYVTFPDIKKIYYKDQNFHRTVKTNTLSRNENLFSLEEDLAINEIKIKLKIDNLVKSIKRKNLKNNEVSLDFAKKLINNIKNKKNNDKIEIVSYSKRNNKKMSAITSESDLYSLLFTETESVDYSHTDIVSKHKVNNRLYRGIDKLKRNNEEINENREEVKTNLKNLTSLYYPKCSFFSSYTLYSKILNDIIKENKINNNETSILKTQALYLNFFKNNKESSIGKENTIRRFFKSAIMKDVNSSEDLKNKKPDDYQYKFEDFDIKDYDKYSKNSVKLYLENILESSPRLESIKKRVFSNKNIRNIADQSNYKCFAGLDFTTNSNNRLLLFSKYGEYFVPVNDAGTLINRVKNEKKLKLTGNMYFNVFPFTMMKYNYIVYGNVKDMLQLDYSRIEKNKIKSEIGQQNDQDNDRVTDENVLIYLVNKEGLDITNTDSIKIRIIPKFNDMKDLRERAANEFSNLVSYPHFEIIDEYEKAVSGDNTIFNSITKKIQELIKLYNKDYLNISFNSEGNIDSFIDQNQDFFQYIQNILEIYAELYLPYFNRMQRKFSLNSFKEVFETYGFENKIKIRNSQSVNRESSENFARGELVRSYLSINQDLSQNERSSLGAGGDDSDGNPHYTGLAMDANNDFEFNPESIGSINGEITPLPVINNNYFNVIEDLEIFNDTNLNSEGNIFLDKEITLNNRGKLYTNFTHKLENIGKSLFRSDVLQAFNLDIISGCIDYQDDIFENLFDPEQELDSQRSFDKLRNILPNTEVDQIEENFYDTFYINCLSKSLYESININKKIEKRVKNGIEEDQNFFKNPNIFKEISQLEIERLNSSFTLHSDESQYRQLSSSSTPEGHINSSFYMFGLSKNQLENIDYTSIIKFTVNIVDKFNLNHVYVPKVFLFSPLYANIDNILFEDFPVGLRENNSIGYYRLNNNINSRLGIVNFESITRLINSFEIGQGQDFMFANIAKKFNIFLNSQTTPVNIGLMKKISNFYRHLINCHANSKENLNIVKTLYSLNSPNFKSVTNDQKIVDSVSLLTNKEFFNIFDIKKEKSILNGSVFYDNVNKAVENNDITYDFISNLSKIGSYEEIYNSKYYEVYSISINPKDFYFFDLANERNLEDFNETNATRYVPTEIENSIRENFGDNNVFFKSTKNLENLSISMKVEII